MWHFTDIHSSQKQNLSFAFIVWKNKSFSSYVFHLTDGANSVFPWVTNFFKLKHNSKGKLHSNNFWSEVQLWPTVKSWANTVGKYSIFQKSSCFSASLFNSIHIVQLFFCSSKPWSSQLWTQFKQLRIDAWKSQDFNGIWTCDLTIAVRHSNQLSYEATDVGSWSFCCCYFTGHVILNFLMPWEFKEQFFVRVRDFSLHEF